MRRAKSNPAKYAKNYRKISQRRMTEENEDPTNEIQRLEALLERTSSSILSSSKTTETSQQNEPVLTDESSTRSKILLLSNEHQSSYVEEKDSDIIILPAKKKRKVEDDDEKPKTLAISSSELKAAQKQRKQALRKLQQLQQRKAQNEKRVSLYAKLEQHQIVVGDNDSSLAPAVLLQSSAELGKRKTTKELLRNILQRERAGIPLNEKERSLLYRSTRTNSQDTVGPAAEEEGDDHLEDEDYSNKTQRMTTTTMSVAMSTVAEVHDDTTKKPFDDSAVNSSDDDPKKPARSIAQQMMESLSTLKSANNISSKTTSGSSLEDDLKKEGATPTKKVYIPDAPIQIKTTQSYDATPVVTPATLPARQNPSSAMWEMQRPAEVIAERATLPVVAMELEVLDSISSNDVTIISAETGSGKSTQIPQFALQRLLLSSSPSNNTNNSMIAITQPRRVAAISIAKRVAYELLGIKTIRPKQPCTVAYQTRYESAGYHPDVTKLKFMTDGILLQEIKNDLLLRNYNVVILDEAHERNLNTDVLIGLLKMSLLVRNQPTLNNDVLPKLKVIVMSATLRIQDFTRVFPDAGIVQIPGRMHSVTIHHAKHTELDRYGKQEILRMMQRLQRALNKNNIPSNSWKQSSVTSDDVGDWSREMDDDEVDGDLYDDEPGDDNDIESSKIESNHRDVEELSTLNAHILPLYSMMPTEEQAKVFAPVPENHRLIVLATNIAETSLTIPGISYVVDCGRQKSRSYHNGVSSFNVMWISQAAADQRAGRAGRTGPGHCYRIYSSSLYSRHMDQFEIPEVLARPLEDIVLAMKAMKIDNVANFPFPTPPKREQVDAAVKLLANIGCLDFSKGTIDGEVTRLGITVSKLPLGVRHGKMLLVAADAGLLDYAIAIVASLSENNSVFLCNQDFAESAERPEATKDDKKEAGEEESEEPPPKPNHKWLHKDGDLIATLLAVGAHSYAGRSAAGASELLAGRKFCKENGLNSVVMERVQTMRRHLAKLGKQRLGSVDGVAAKTGGILSSMTPPNLSQSRLLCQSIASGLLDNVAHLAPPGSLTGDHPYSLRLAYIGCTTNMKEPLFMDRNSVLFTRDYRRLPQWVCYESLQRKTLRDGQTVSIMKNLTPIDPSWFCFLAKGSHMLSLGEALQSPIPTYDEREDTIMCSVKTKYGSHGWEIPCIQQSMALSISAKGKSVFTEDDLYRWFGRFLLDGKIFPELKVLEHMLNDPPSVITRKISSTKVIVLVSALSRHGINSKNTLIKHWTNVDDKFLFSLMKKWIRPERADDFKKIWINLVKSIVSG